MSEINVLYAFDTRYWKMAAVSIYSLLKNCRNDTICNIHCMVAPYTHGRRNILKIVNNFKNARLVWRPIHKHDNPFIRYDFSRWSPVIFYRLFAHRIFPHLDKILYLDSDTLIFNDLTELYNTDISGFTMGAVRDMAPTEDLNNKNGKYVHDFANKYLKNGPYFNSGVLLINLKNMAKNQELLTKTNIPLKYPDQDILNVALRDKIKALELKYNYAPGVHISKNYPKKWVTDVKAGNYCIMHFYTVKPYDYTHAPHEIYSQFYKIATDIGIHPEELVKQDIKYSKSNKIKKKSVIPFVKVHENKIRLFGITIIRI